MGNVATQLPASSIILGQFNPWETQSAISNYGNSSNPWQTKKEANYFSHVPVAHQRH